MVDFLSTMSPIINALVLCVAVLLFVSGAYLLSHPKDEPGTRRALYGYTLIGGCVAVIGVGFHLMQLTLDKRPSIVTLAAIWILCGSCLLATGYNIVRKRSALRILTTVSVAFAILTVAAYATSHYTFSESWATVATISLFIDGFLIIALFLVVKNILNARLDKQDPRRKPPKK